LVKTIHVQNKIKNLAEADQGQTMYWDLLGTGYTTCGVGMDPLIVYATTPKGALMKYNTSTS